MNLKEYLEHNANNVSSIEIEVRRESKLIRKVYLDEHIGYNTRRYNEDVPYKVEFIENEIFRGGGCENYKEIIDVIPKDLLGLEIKWHRMCSFDGNYSDLWVQLYADEQMSLEEFL